MVVSALAILGSEEEVDPLLLLLEEEELDVYIRREIMVTFSNSSTPGAAFSR